MEELDVINDMDNMYKKKQTIKFNRRMIKQQPAKHVSKTRKAYCQHVWKREYDNNTNNMYEKQRQRIQKSFH